MKRILRFSFFSFFLLTSVLKAQDAGVLNILSPQKYSCTSGATSLQVVVKNFGSSSQSNLQVKIVLSGPTNQTFTDTLKKTLSSGGYDTLTFKSTASTSAGSYNIKAYTTLSGDVNHSNDTFKLTALFTQTPAAPNVTNGKLCG